MMAGRTMEENDNEASLVRTVSGAKKFRPTTRGERPTSHAYP